MTWRPSARAVLQVLPAVAGPRLGSDVQTVIRAVRAGDWTREGDTIVAGGIPLEEGEYTLRLVAAEDAGASTSLPSGDGVVVLDLDVTPELEAEGLGTGSGPHGAAGPPRCRASTCRTASA